jgi:hypothetical protein
LGVGELTALIVLHDLFADPFDCLGLFVTGGGGPHIDRDSVQSCRAGGESVALPGAHAELSVGIAHGGDRRQYAVFFDTGQEVGVNVGFVAHVDLQDQCVRVDVFEAAGGVMRAVGGIACVGGDGVGHLRTLAWLGRPCGRPLCLPSGT